MGVFDFIKTKQAPKVSNVSVNSPRPNANSRGTVTVDKFTFNVRDYSLKGLYWSHMMKKYLQKVKNLSAVLVYQRTDILITAGLKLWSQK